MSLLVVAPEWLTSAAAELQSIESALNAANAAAAVPTTGLAAAAADEVSTAVATLFAGLGQEYQAISTQLSAFQQQFALTLNSSAGSYAAAEAQSVSVLDTLGRDVFGAINAPTEALLGRPLIGNGANGTATSPNGEAGGLLFGNGGIGYSQTGSGIVGGAGGSAGLIGNGGAGAPAVPARPVVPAATADGSSVAVESAGRVAPTPGAPVGQVDSAARRACSVGAATAAPAASASAGISERAVRAAPVASCWVTTGSAVRAVTVVPCRWRLSTSLNRWSTSTSTADTAPRF